MRIRKRQVPFGPPFSSDPLLLHRAPPVQLASDPPPHASDSPLRDAHSNASEEKLVMKLEEEEGENRNETREIRRVFGAETSYGILPQESTSSPQGVVGRWCEREKAFPLKKRRGSFERPIEDHKNNEEITTAADDTSEMIIIKKTNKKCTTSLLQQKQEQEQPEESKVGPDLAGRKKRSRGGALMEGSRCSRVNGRGWRCCQQTLVGYSLCEHHLGKGRLRSINTVRRRSFAAPLPPPPPPPPLTVASKKKIKLGVVKARSISSLLGQTDNVMAAPPYPPPLPPPADNVNE